MGIRVSGSRLSLLFKCAFAFRPEIEVPEQEPVGRPAHTGVGFASLREHDLEPGRRPEAPELPVQARLDVHHVGGRSRADRLIDRWRRWWEDYRVENPMRWESEIPFAFDPIAGTARRLPISEHRAYEGALPHEFVGTADMVGTSTTRIAVLDDKTGQKAYVAPARENPQLRFLSLCHSIVTGIDRGKVGLVFPHLDREEMLDEVPFGPDAIEKSLRVFMDVPAKIASSRPEIGDHCRLCPLRQECPGWRPKGSFASTDELFGARPRAVSSAPAPAGKDGEMARVRVVPGKMAQSAPQPAQVPPTDRSDFAEPAQAPSEELPLAPTARRVQTPEDNDFAPKKGVRGAPRLGGDFERIVEHTFTDLPFSEYERLEKELRVGERRSDRAALIEALDHAEDNARLAHRFYVAATVERLRWEAEAEVIRAPMRSDVVGQMEADKRAKIRTKDITETDVRSMIAAQHGDEYRWQEEREAKIKGMEKHLGEFASLWQSRCATLRAMIDKVR